MFCFASHGGDTWCETARVGRYLGTLTRFYTCSLSLPPSPSSSFPPSLSLLTVLCGCASLPRPRPFCLRQEGWRNVVLKGLEGPVLPALLLAGSVGLTYSVGAGKGATSLLLSVWSVPVCVCVYVCEQASVRACVQCEPGG